MVMGYRKTKAFFRRIFEGSLRSLHFQDPLDPMWLKIILNRPFWWPFLVLKIRHLWPEAEPGVVMNDLAAEDNELFLCFLSSVFACVAVLQPDKSLPMRCAGGFCRWASRVWSSANQFWAFYLSYHYYYSHWFCILYSVILETFFLVFVTEKKHTSTQTIIMVLSSSHHQDDHHLNLANNWKIRGIWTP